MRIRPLGRDDLAAARALLVAEEERHPYAARPLALLDAAAEAEDGEYRALVATDGDDVIGVVLYGLVAGSVGAGAVYGVVVAPPRRRAGVGRGLLGGALAGLAEAGARVAVVELPDDEALADVRGLLRRCGFAEEARVPDLVRDGVAVVFWRRDLTSPPGAPRRTTEGGGAAGRGGEGA